MSRSSDHSQVKAIYLYSGLMTEVYTSINADYMIRKMRYCAEGNNHNKLQ